MPRNSKFRLPRGHRFFPKHGSYGCGAKSRWGLGVPLGQKGQRGPTGSKKWVKTQKITMHRISNFRQPSGHPFFTKNGSNRYGAKSRWGPRRVHLWANGVPLGKKNGSNPQKIPMPPNLNCRLPRSHRFFPKIGSYDYSAKSWWGPPRVNLGANGVPLGPKNRSKP